MPQRKGRGGHGKKKGAREKGKPSGKSAAGVSVVERGEAGVIKPRLSGMTHRERFRRLMHFQTVDRVVHWEFGYIDETMERWHKEGLPPRKNSIETIEAYFGVDPAVRVRIGPMFDPEFTGKGKVLEVRANSVVYEHADGTVTEEIKEGLHTIPHFIKFPISGRDDWARFKERLRPDTPGREIDWDTEAPKYRNLDVPVGIGLGSYFGIPRNWIGFENISLMLYDDRELVEEIVETLTRLYLRQLEDALTHVEVDFAAGWEDICFRNGPMLSPRMFGEIVVPRLKRVTACLRQHGVDVIWTDCDGDITQLVPYWLDAGVNCMFPLEVHPGSDPVKFRKMYGRRVLLRGGVAKYQLALGKKEILAELKRIEKIVEEGGYIPHGDHRIPNDVPYDNYRYYIREKLAMLGFRSDEIGEIEPLGGAPARRKKPGIGRRMKKQDTRF